MNAIFRIYLILSCLSVVLAEHFRSHYDLQKLLHTDEQVVKTLENFYQLEKTRINELENLLKEYKELHIAGKQDHDLMNPINVFLLIRRLTIAVDEITSRLLNEGLDQKGAMEATINQLTFPDQDDFHGAIDAILRLQDTYELPASDIARERLATDIVSDYQLSARDCADIGKRAYENDYYNLAIEWIIEALSRHDAHHERNNIASDPQNLPSMYEVLSKSCELEGDVRKAIEWNNKLLDSDPNHKGGNERNVRLEKMVLDAVVEEEINASKEFNTQHSRRSKHVYAYEPFRKACQGKLSPSDQILSQLKCSYVSPSPFTRLARLKQEEAYLNPRILIYRDVLNDGEIEVLKRLSHPEFRETAEGDYRVAKWSWLRDGNNEVIPRLTRRVEDMTGYTMATAENFTVINYGIGGHYQPHFDVLEADEMSQVQRGGGTIFPFLNLTIWPEKGSALVWWNLHIDGSKNRLMMHGSCPVLFGSKWVTIKWIHATGQELHNPCRLDRTKIQTERRLI